MALYDRHYYRDGSGGGGGGDFLQGLLRVLNASFPIGTYLGIRVRVHITFFALVLIYMFTQGDPLWTLRIMSLLFISVLLHEFGHCLACRRVGGEANDILMWPLGGLAFCLPPRRPWPEFVTVVWGPLVNVILAVGAYLSLLALVGLANMPVNLNPLQPLRGWSGLEGVLADFFVVNYYLLLFNLLLIFYPFDGGRLIQIALWTRMGYGQSMRLATSFGLVGAVLVGVFGFAVNRSLLVLIAIFGGFACWQQKQALRAGAYEAAEDWSSGGAGGAAPRAARKGVFTRIREQRAERTANREETRQRQLEAEVDRILDKVHAEGINSLTARERKVLEQASDEKK